MDIYAEIRRKHREGRSERGIAKDLHINRKTVRRYLNGGNIPGERSSYTRRASRVMTAEVKEFIEGCLAEDEREKTSKQNHTAKRIYDRLVAKKGFTGGESTIRGMYGSIRIRHKKHSYR